MVIRPHFESSTPKVQIVQAEYGNGTTTDWTYEQFGRINGHTTKDESGQVLLNNTYQYDAIGNLTKRQDFIQSVTESFNYVRVR